MTATLYRLPELLAADPQEVVFLCEGEKDVDRLRSIGLVATTTRWAPTGWQSSYNQYLRGRRVIILQDNDEAGEQRVRKVSASLRATAVEVCKLLLDGLPEHGDVSYWFDAGGSVEELRELAAAAPSAVPEPRALKEARRKANLKTCSLS